MSPTSRPRATAVAVASALLLLTGCGGSESSGDDAAEETLGWFPKEDEVTGIDFALPPPSSGPEEQRRPGKETAVESRGYAARAGEITLAVQFLSTPESPASLDKELPAQRMPYVVVDQIRAEGDYMVDVLSNRRVEEIDQPTYDAVLQAEGDGEEAIWVMRSRAFDDFVLVTQVVGFPEGETDAELERRVRTAFDRLNGTVRIPDSLE